MEALTAVDFQSELTEGGRSKPLLIDAVSPSDDYISVVVKLASNTETLDAGRLVREAVTTRLAVKLGLPAPECYRVAITNAFIRSVEGINDRISNRLKEHVALAGEFAYGTEYIQGVRIFSPSEVSILKEKDLLAEIFSFDAMTLNRDRCIPSAGNPNLLISKTRCYLIDHEQALDTEALGFGETLEPWLRGSLNGMCNFLEHIFYSALKGESWSLTRIESAWENLVADDLSSLFINVPIKWGTDTLRRDITSYLNDLIDNRVDAFNEVRRALS